MKNYFPEPGTPEFLRLPKHMQKRALRNYADERRLHEKGAGKQNKAGSNVKAENCLPLRAMALWC